MNRRLAIIHNNIVTNVIMWDDEETFVPTEECIAVFDEQASPGWSYDGTTFIQPEPIIEETI